MRNNIVFCAFMLIGSILHSQHIQSILAARNDSIVNNQIPLLKKQIDSLKHTNHNDTLGIAYYFLSDKFYKNLSDIDSALHYSTLAELTWKNYIINSDRRVLNFYNTVKYYEADNQLKSLVSYFLNHYKDIDQNQRLDVYAVTLKKTIAALQTLGDNETALRILEYFLSLEKDNSSIVKQLSDLYLEKGKIESALHQYSKAKVSYEQAIQYENNLPKDIQTIGRRTNIVNQQFILLNESGHPKEAIELVNDFLTQIKLPRDKIMLIGNLGYSLIESRKYEQAIQYTNIAYTDINLISEEQYLNKASFIQNYAEALMHVDSLDKAKVVIDQAFDVALNGKSQKLDSLLTRPDKNVLVEILYQKSRILFRLYKRTAEEDYKNTTVKTIIAIDEISQSIIDDQLFDASIINLKERSSKYYRHAIDAFYYFDDWANLFLFSEKNRNLLLLKNIMEETHNHLLMDSLHKLKTIEQNLHYAIYTKKQDSLRTSLIELQQQLILVESKIKSDTKESSIQLIDLGDDIYKNKIVFYYQYGQDSLYLLSFVNTKMNVKPLASIEVLNEMLESYLTLVHDNKQIFDTSLSKKLASILIPDPSILQSHLLIIPDKQLNYLPFESLLLKDDSYLLDKASISYCSSLSLFHHLDNMSSQPIEILNIISPDYKEMQLNDLIVSATKGKMTFNYLVHSKNEVGHISEILPAIITEGIDIDKNDVLNQLSEAEAVHFTGHAVMIPGQDKLSFLALAEDWSNIDNVITMGEISSLNTNAELIFMNACNTGNGTYLDGEGVYDLSRAFLSAGAKSIISSMWEIDDQSSSEITISFYKYLKKGESKSNALRLAKLDYIKNVETDRAKHPYYWAGLVAIGNVDPVHFQSNPIPVAIWVGLGLLILLLLFRRQLSQLLK